MTKINRIQALELLAADCITLREFDIPDELRERIIAKIVKQEAGCDEDAPVLEMLEIAFPKENSQ